MKTPSTSNVVGAVLVIVFALSGSVSRGQIILNNLGANGIPNNLVNALMGQGVFASNVTFNGRSGGMQGLSLDPPADIGSFNGMNTVLGMNGVYLCTGIGEVHIPGPNDRMQVGSGGIVAGGGGGGGSNATPDLDLSHLTGWPYWQVSGGNNIHTKAMLEFDFVPVKDMVSFRYVFSSEEYERWGCSEYNDVFGFFISGPGIPSDVHGPIPFTNNALNMAFVPGALSRVSINTVNSGRLDVSNANGPDFVNIFGPCFDADPNWRANSRYYRYNGGQWQNPGGVGGAQLEAPYNTDPYYIQHNGMTVTLTASAAVQCGERYHIKIAVGNVGDAGFPSAVFIERNSFTSTDRFSMSVAPGRNVEYADNDTILIENDCDSVYLRFHRWGGFYLDEWLQIRAEGSSTGGVDYHPLLPDSVHFNQLDSTSVVAIAVPVDGDGLEDLIVKLITCNGLKIQTYQYPIDQRPPLEVELEDVDLECPAVVTLTPEVTGGGNEPSEYEYLWSTGETTASISPYVQESTQFWVRVKDCWTEPVTDSAWVRLPPYDPMELVLTPDTAIPCLGTAVLRVEASLGAGDYTYAWSLNRVVQGTEQELEVPAPTTGAVYYVVEVTDLCEVVAMDSVLVSQAPPVPLELALTPDTAIACLGHADLVASISGGGGVISYRWRHGGSVVGTDSVLNVPAAEFEVYEVEVNDQCGQTVTGRVEVTTGPTPPLVLQAEGDTVLCAHMPLMLQVLTVSGGGGAYSYVWSPVGSGPANGPLYEVRLDDDAYFTVMVTDECGNMADTTLAAVVLDHDPLVITSGNDTLVCPGEEIPLWVLVEGGAGGNVIEWPGIGTGDSLSWVTGRQSRAVVVNVTDACGERVSDTVLVEVHPAYARIGARELGDSQWRFEAHTQPADGNELEWDLGDGTIVQNVLTVEHTYADIEAHWVYLYMVTPEGCRAVDSVQTTPPSATLYFPNAFSPNGDGHNETFGGEGTLLDRYELYVFDRWGRIVFESHDPRVRWDGTQDGEAVMNGVYQYKYIVKGMKMPLKQGFGHVTLIR